MASSWVLVRFLSAAAQRDLKYHVFNESEWQKLARRSHHSLVTENSQQCYWESGTVLMGLENDLVARNCYKAASRTVLPKLSPRSQLPPAVVLVSGRLVRQETSSRFVF